MTDSLATDDRATDGPDDVVAKVLHQIAPEVSVGDIDPDALLHEQVDLDSMDFLNFVAGLHDETGLDIPERDYPQIATLSGCRSYLRTHQPD